MARMQIVDREGRPVKVPRGRAQQQEWLDDLIKSAGVRPICAGGRYRVYPRLYNPTALKEDSKDPDAIVSVLDHDADSGKASLRSRIIEFLGLKVAPNSATV